MSKYTDEQLQFVDYKGEDSIILSATAGSGKTHSSVGRLNRMIDDGVNPKDIIFFSFTNDAVNELRHRIKHDVKITTIHSFTSSMLGKMGKFKPIVTFFDFANWYKDKYKPKATDPIKTKLDYAKIVDKFYEESGSISAAISAYKLQMADNVPALKPNFYNEYRAFITETKSRDFSDMLIDTEKFSRDPKYKHHFEGAYKYIFVDEYQDTSTLQMKILLAVKANQYHLIGDKNQSIYGFSGANCEAIENLLMKNYKVKELTLTQNFRSGRKIVENANKYSQLKAVPFHDMDGHIEDNLIDEDKLYEMMEDGKALTVLVRTNAVIKEIEKHCLKKKIPMKYFNFISPQDVEKIKEGKLTASLKKKLEEVSPYHKNTQGLLAFIEEHQSSNVFVTSIHKSKGREFPRVVVVNSIDPDVLLKSDYEFENNTYINDYGEIDQEAQNVHYVAVTRPKEELYFLVYEN